jgi:hypothetical protein
MSDPAPANARRSRQRAHIALADDVLMPRREFAEDILGVTDKTAARMNLPTTYVGNVAHVLKNASLRVVESRVRRPNQRQPRRAVRAR